MENSDIQFSTLPAKQGVLGLIVLNRPQALNALSFEMLSAMKSQLQLWQDDEQVKAVIVKSSSSRAFCAGGDIRALYENRLRQWGASHPYFSLEYRLNQFLHHFTKPYIAFLDGITMGGGVGISLHGSHTVASERCQWAMPESKLGFFPDVGASYHLSRAPDMLGWYLALSGRTIDVATAFDLRIVNSVIASEHWPDVEQALQNTVFAKNAHDTVSDVLQSFHTMPEPCPLGEYYPLIRRCFSQPSCAEIIEALAFENTDWCLELREELLSRSPFSLKLIFEQLHRAVNMTFDEVIEQDLVLVNHFVRDADFYEGIRAAVIDKDQSPQWTQNELTHISHEDVLHYFHPIEAKV